VEGDWLLNTGSEGLSTESTWCGSSGSFLGFEHWEVGVGGQQDDYIHGNFYGGINFHDVLSSDPNYEFLGELHADTTSTFQQQIGDIQMEYVDHSFPRELAHFDVLPDLEGNIDLQVSRDAVSEGPHQLEATQYRSVELDKVSFFPDLLLCPSSQSNIRKEIQVTPEPSPAVDTSLEELTRIFSSDRSSRESCISTQAWICDFPNCGRICPSRQKLRYSTLNTHIPLLYGKTDIPM